MTGGSIFPFTKGVPAHNLQKIYGTATFARHIASNG